MGKTLKWVQFVWNSREGQAEGGAIKQEGKTLINSEFRKGFHRSVLSISSKFVGKWKPEKQFHLGLCTETLRVKWYWIPVMQCKELFPHEIQNWEVVTWGSVSWGQTVGTWSLHQELKVSHGIPWEVSPCLFPSLSWGPWLETCRRKSEYLTRFFFPLSVPI